MQELDALRYPVGRFSRTPGYIEPADLAPHFQIIEEAPARFRALVTGLSDAQLETPYRPGGWTIRQVIHHVVDSHMNAYIRMKLAATEDKPAIKTYEERLWAELPEAKSAPIEMSLALLEALHRRWLAFLRMLPPKDFSRTFRHPDWGDVTIAESITLYSWHCRHHAAHIERAPLGTQRD